MYNCTRENSFYGGCNEPLCVCIRKKCSVERNSIFAVATQIRFCPSLSGTLCPLRLECVCVSVPLYMMQGLRIGIGTRSRQIIIIVKYPLKPGYRPYLAKVYCGKYYCKRRSPLCTHFISFHSFFSLCLSFFVPKLLTRELFCLVRKFTSSA